MPGKSGSGLLLLYLKARRSRVNLYPFVQAVCDWVIGFCAPPPTPPLSGTFIELPPCGLSSCSFWSQHAAVVNWSVMDSTAGKVRQSALLMHSPPPPQKLDVPPHPRSSPSRSAFMLALADRCQLTNWSKNLIFSREQSQRSPAVEQNAGPAEAKPV